MIRRCPTIKQLASEAKLDSEAALIRLWYAGFEKVINPTDRIYGDDLKRAKKVLGIVTAQELTTIQYWQAHFGLEKDEFAVFLKQLSIQISSTATKLPKGTVKKLKCESRKIFNPEYMFSKTQGMGTRSIISSKSEEEKINIDEGLPKIEWNIIGHKRNLRWLNYEEILNIHKSLVDDFSESNDPIIPPGCRSENLLASAVFRPQTSNGEEFKYPTVEMSAGALLHALIHDHPFHNGNKRTALVSMLAFLDENNFILTCQEDELFMFVLKVAMHRVVDDKLKMLSDHETLAIANWIITNSRPIERGNRPMVFRKLRRVLNAYNCSFDMVGSAMNITRTVKERGFFGRTKIKRLHTQVTYHAEGRELRNDAINKIRFDLHLDEPNGIDSKAFYENAAVPIGDFIVTYRKTLNRLAKL